MCADSVTQGVLRLQDDANQPCESVSPRPSATTFHTPANLKKILFCLIPLGVLALTVIASTGALQPLFSANYLPHRYCYLAKPGLVWTNVVSDGLIAIAYGTIFGCLIWIARKLRKIQDVRTYMWILLSFGMFIVACGATHLMEVVTIWWPVYPLSAAVKVICVAASLPTAFLFARATPVLAERIRRFLEILAVTGRQRDRALVALNTSESLAAQCQRATEDLATVNKQLNSVLDCTSDSVITISHKWVLLYGNGKALADLPDFKVGGDYWSCFPPALGTSTEQNLRAAMEGQTEAAWENYFAPYKRWYGMRAFPTGDGLSIFFRNITEEKRMQAQLELEQSLREKRIEALSHMAGGLAHEISNPLAIIHGRASDLMSRAAGDEPVSSLDVHKACENIVKTSDRAIRILRGLRGFGREASRDPMELASVYEIARYCMELQQSRFDDQNIEVRLTLKPGIPPFLCREVQIGQIVTNLLNNAFDSIVQSHSVVRWISLGAKYLDGDIQLDVTDSGPGVDDQFKAHLMKLFFTTKELGLGMGVGLSLSRAIAQDHGGSLTLVPDTPYTCFRLILPIKESDANQEQALRSIGGVLSS
jgi:signal transduction histidine kinase